MLAADCAETVNFAAPLLGAQVSKVCLTFETVLGFFEPWIDELCCLEVHFGVSDGTPDVEEFGAILINVRHCAVRFEKDELVQGWTRDTVERIKAAASQLDRLPLNEILVSPPAGEAVLSFRDGIRLRCFPSVADSAADCWEIRVGAESFIIGGGGSLTRRNNPIASEIR
jgi:hypothetical protein